MAEKVLESGALSAFCGSVATMLSAGIQTDEAVLMLAENRKRSRFQEVCNHMYSLLADGSSFADAMKSSGGFPTFAVEMAATGEQSGNLEQVLRNLEVYYDEEERMFNKLRSTVGYPATLLVIMAIILTFTVFYILPVFANVYENITGSLASSSFISAGLSSVIGWVSLVITVLSAIAALALLAASRSEAGRARAVRLFERLTITRDAMRQMALSRFTASLAACVSSGVTNEEALSRAARAVEHRALRRQILAAHDTMRDPDDPQSLARALGEQKVFEPLYARMLNVGIRSGNLDDTLAQMSSTFFDDAVAKVDRALDRIEPLFAAFLTVAIGFTIIAVMLPLVGIMGSIG